MDDNNGQQNQKGMSRSMRLKAQAFKNVQERLKQLQQQNEPHYLNESHKESEEAKAEYLDSLNPSEIDWGKEKERQKRNSRND